MNNSSNEVSRNFELSLTCALTSASGSSESVLWLNTNSSKIKISIAPGSFIKEEYLLNVAPTISGQVRLDVSNYNQVVILVEAGSSGALAATQTPPPLPKTKTARPLTEIINNNISSHLSFYEPIYFILGTYPAAEFQLSVKYQIFTFTNVNPFANISDHIYFAYTQTSFWDLISQDPSFYDTSYKPSVFIYYPHVLQGTNEAFFHLDLQGGTEHESNGRGGSLERSLYTAYLQPTARFDLLKNLQLTLQPRTRLYYWVSDNNPDIANYRGYADLLTALTWRNSSEEKIQLATKLRIGDEGTHAGLQFDLRFNLAAMAIFRSFNPTIQVQYFTGYGQTLRQYNQTSHGLRAGLCLWY